tara:strand:+ start:787 stop:1005 length:219 start_codon:yes stop_codon:yes gene_type:complete
MAKFVTLNHNVMISGKSVIASDDVIVIDDADFRVLSTMNKQGRCYITEVEKPEAKTEPEKTKRKTKTQNKKV